MIKDDFEKHIRAKLEHATTSVPDALWANIDQYLSNEVAFENKITTEFGANVIEPPASLWTSIEAELNKKTRRKPFVWLFFNKWTLSGVAALLLISLGWFWKTQQTLDTPVAENKHADNQQIAGTTGPLPSQSSSSSVTKSSDIQLLIAGQTSSAVIIENTIGGSGPAQKENETSLVELTEESSYKQTAKEEKLFSHIEVDPLASSPYFHFTNSFVLSRVKLPFDNAVAEIIPDKRQARRRSWLGLLSGFMPFEPNLSFPSFERATVVSASNAIHSVPVNSGPTSGIPVPNPTTQEAFAIPLTQPYAKVNNGNGVNVGLNFGRMLSRLFSIETGIRYFSGTVSVSSNVFALENTTGNISTFLESRYIKKDVEIENVVVGSNAMIDNRYDYLMLPFQVGMYLPISDKTEIAIGMGISTDFFISNTFDNFSGNKSRLNALNSSYKLFHLSGLGSVIAGRTIGKNWQLKIGSQLQRCLSAALKTSDDFSYKPRYISVNTSINYRIP